MFVTMWALCGCAGGQDPQPVTQENIEDKLMKACGAACMAYEFTDCGQTMQRNLNVGEMLTAGQEVVETVIEVVEELTEAQAVCAAKCLTLADSLAHNATPEELPFGCLANVKSCEAVDECFR